MNLIQIGTNTANDEFYQIVKSLDKKEIENLILVEPLSNFNEEIKNCYKNYNFILENVVINTDESKNKEKFFISKYHWLSSMSKNHINKHFNNSNVLDIVEKEIESKTLNSLFRKYNIKKIDILFIDAEGYDDSLIKSINFDEFNIEKIYYEDVHINNQDLITFFNNLGYKVDKAGFKDNLTSLAIKI
jgi:FkbM family methyltransferase